MNFLIIIHLLSIILPDTYSLFPDYIRTSNRAKTYTKKTLHRAVNAIKSGILTINVANSLHNILLITSKDRVSKEEGKLT